MSPETQRHSDGSKPPLRRGFFWPRVNARGPWNLVVQPVNRVLFCLHSGAYSGVSDDRVAARLTTLHPRGRGTMKRITAAALLIMMAALAPHPTMAQDGRTLMLEGNELFRDGLYRAALLRYREANAAGLDSPLLHYNLGVTSYKVQRYDDAEASLERAVADPRRAPFALYNLGLTARAKREELAAERWFRLALERADRRELRTLAEAGLQSVTVATPASSNRRTARRFVTPTDHRVGEFNFIALARLGQDDNVYRAPSEPYIDLAQPGQPLVTPVVQSASFMPLDLLAEYVLFNEAGDTDFNFTYILNGDFYGSEFSNANEISQRFELGADVEMGRRRNIGLESAFFVRGHQETNFDPDDGLDRDIGGVDISQRFSYGAAGIKTNFDHTIGRWTWGFDLRFERRQYDDAPPVTNYDHELYYTRAGAEYAITDSTRVKLGGRYYRRLYDERLSRDINGDLLATNPALRYRYRGVELGMEHDFGRLFRLEFDYLRVDRMDLFAGYYDYDQHVYRLGGTFRAGRRFRLSIAAISRTYDYWAAFAFNDPAAGLKDLEDVSGELIMEYRITPRLALSAELWTDDVVSSDPRAAYTRSQSMIGIRWRQ